VTITATVLVVAPDRLLRESVAFLLEAEGCRVRQLVALPTAGAATAPFDCAVVDEAAFARGANGLRAWDGLTRPAVLLTDRCKDGDFASGVRMVEKPIHGAALIEAVRAVLG